MGDSAASTELLAAAKDLAARNVDCYALLGLPSPDDANANAAGDAPTSLTRDAVQRAWRKRAPMYHPDQAGAAFDQAKWEQFGLARDVLASEEARAAYDGARAAASRKRRERDLMSSRQRRFAEELERAEGGAAARGKQEEEEARARRAREEEDKARQTARGRAVVEERRRKVEEAEARERERERKEDEQRDDKIRRLEEKIAEKARRRAEKKAKREGRRGVVSNADEDVDMLSPHPAVPAPAESKPFAQQPKTTAPLPAAVDVQMSDDPVQFWETQWPKTKARLLAAQATKERRVKEAQAAA